jgi:exodeoxyribonuclease VII large subunit
VEDLLPFSDEALIRAVHRVRTPVVSAIGHEPDSPLLDLVADWRASTPTDAAKRIVPDMAEETAGVTAMRDRGRAAVGNYLDREQAGLDSIRSRPVMADPRNLLDERAAEIDLLVQRTRRTVGHRLDRAGDDIGHQLARARALSPLATLQRGYAVVQDDSGRVVTSVEGVDTGRGISVRVADGRIHATTTTTELIDTEDAHA